MSKPTVNFKRAMSLVTLFAALSFVPISLQAQETIVASEDSLLTSEQQNVELNQAELDQMLAPIALYPDTLLSHILVAATYPLEIIQAARWREANKDLDEDQALNAVEDKDWDPSVKALVPFNDLLQKFSEDLDWLQGLGDAFLSNEAQVLATVQNLRQKAYAQGNLQNNEYVEVAQDNNEITIQTVQKEVIYVPYYDTRVVYGNWWWEAYPPYYWHSPSHYAWHNGVYWSPRYYIRPAFYYGGFRWHDRYVYVDYDYRSRAQRNWSHDTYRQVVRNREYSRWQHNEVHRRGVHYTTNGRVVSRDYSRIQTNPNRFVTNSSETSTKKRQQIDKQRVLDINRYPAEKGQVKRNQLHNEQRSTQVQEQLKATKVHNDKQRLVDQSTNQQRTRVVDNRQRDQHRNNQVSAERQRIVKSEQHVESTKQQRTEQKSEQNNQRQYQSNRETSSDNNRQRSSSRQNNDASRNKSTQSNKTERRVKD
ncbi:DUF3300 domain-containing protein [Paraglaciecola hydrolytica]|uniref:DUF3300 domain-containing protein n=1 Tax=Paraglaciecola hydrolytica TaxID=1799789 RepID=A0A136A259_9ALTE|nr:DUF3300 domain-containing protein [Paraglaciecola hydrolytica]KXI29287.1 hypothetical protein AX660_14180 [Paraglaciecola hydrolytica]